MPPLRSRRTSGGLTAATIALTAALSLTAGPALAGPVRPGLPEEAPGREGPPLSSAITAVEATTSPLRVGDRTWQRTTGVVHGVVDPREQVAGLADLVMDDEGYRYSAEFELIAPPGAGVQDVVLVEAENRGRPAVLLSLEQFALGTDARNPTAAVYPDGLGLGFLAEQEMSYARVQWETGIAAGVPATAQGVGEVIVRDFGRLLEQPAARPTGAPALPSYRSSVLAGISQSAWFVNTFVAEGFNVDDRTGRGVYDAALAVSGAGNWLAINQLAGDAPQRPYVLEDGVPLRRDEILTRRTSDPLFVDVATYTDYYRLRASLTAERGHARGGGRYDWPAPHAGLGFADALVFGALGCNGGTVVARNPLTYDPYLRTLVADLAAIVPPGGADRGRLPEPAVFQLRPAPADDPAAFNGLPGVQLAVPVVDRDTAMPRGGVRFPDAVVPLGRPVPVALSPVGTSSITDVCGNWGGWQPFTAEELQARYGTVEGYLVRYAAAVDQQIRAGYLAAAERERMLAGARAAYLAATA
ncbi:alpha/beta hydrolase domain-containing protein [Blastococcus sp. VKM Ac-2987]|uniref:alpha/beta hydrolase domain-containing protein n=1 Tax=Blastococcus sp. VKM Ac-2987 TaxID=3004141 RepID=UPI0022AB9798|nr:alpha/beta hydrolase domain-containing protein [Blastococcus sp. VKM Ac-2987]MCZ2860221.1 alpha/beta hydrolase domain-containing protein [Blastococcus sp. VKM Ac-2987]